MALRRTEPQWKEFMQSAGITDDERATTYAQNFVEQNLTELSIPALDKETLTELGITTIGDRLSILNLAKASAVTIPATQNTPSTKATVQTKLSTVTLDMTHPQFRKFENDWKVYKSITNLQQAQFASHLYNTCDDPVQNSLLNTHPDYLDYNEVEALEAIKSIVTQRINPELHRMEFRTIQQLGTESIKELEVKLRSSAKECAYSCPNCHFDLSETNIRGQFIQALRNKTLQTDVLAKSDQLKTLDELTKHCESYEAAVRDQERIHANSQQSRQNDTNVYRVDHSDPSGSRYNLPPTQHQPPPTRGRGRGARQQQPPRQPPRQTLPPPPQPPQHTPTQNNVCNGCGSTSHRRLECPAWNEYCNSCGVQGHLARVCRNGYSRQTGSSSQPISAFNWEPDNPENDTDRILAVQQTEEDEAIISPPKEDEIQVVVSLGHEKSPQPCTADVNIFPDSGASICLAGLHHLEKLGIDEDKLIPCNKQVKVVGGGTIPCIGWIPAVFSVGGLTTKQFLYVSHDVNRIFFSKRACMDVGILHPNFPQPMRSHCSSDHSVLQLEEQTSNIKAPQPQDTHPRRAPPPKPATVPYEFTESSIPQLKQYIIDSFKDSAFNNSPPFPVMNHRKGHIHLKPDAIPYAVHSPIRVPYHEKAIIKAQLEADVARGIIKRVPIGTPVVWCAQMVVTHKKDGRPRITVDYQRLNRQCLRETHHCEPPFHLASQVPKDTKKTVLDAVDSYYSVELDEESQLLTTFITEWGRLMYLRVPQGFIAAGDMFTSRYDDIIKDVPRKVKIVDDTLLYDDDIESSFWSTWDYLTLCANNGVVINEDKFEFSQDRVDFAGLVITKDGILPSNSILSTIADFPIPTDLHSARQWFGLVNQVSWAHAISPIMQPFRDLIKPHTKFYWDDILKNLFLQSRQLIVDKVKEGVKSFELGRRTCVQTDWCKEGIGYLLLQKHCRCSDDTNIRCCPDGWRLIFAGSRFTKPAESRYSATEGETLAAAWSLKHSKMYTLGCTDLIVSVDHKPLLGILNDRNLGDIDNPRLQDLKEHTLKWNYTIVHNPGKSHAGADAVSRNPSIQHLDIVECFPPTRAITEIFREETENATDFSFSYSFHLSGGETVVDSEEKIQSIGIRSLHSVCKTAITLKDIQQAGLTDPIYQSLITTIKKGFPSTRSLSENIIRKFWEVRDRLYSQDGVVYMDKRVVIPSTLQKEILAHLHSANQGVTGMRKRANITVYWPGMSAAINNYRKDCLTCEENAPSQPPEPIIMSPPPEWPFQQLCADYFDIDGHYYLIVVDRYSGYPCISHFKPGQATTNNLIKECRFLFSTFGVPEEWGSDGGPQFKQSFQEFLDTWGVRHRLSSVDYPQSNGRAEAGVKTAKRILLENLNKDGSLNNDKVTAALLQYKNTPLPDIDLSPAQILFHRELRDSIPSHRSNYHLHKDWVIAAEERELLFTKRHQVITERYNQHTRLLRELPVGTYVLIQTGKNKWKKQGVIVEALRFRQYRIKVLGSGRITLRNRRFIKPCVALNPPPEPIQIPHPTHVRNTNPVHVDYEYFEHNHTHNTVTMGSGRGATTPISTTHTVPSTITPNQVAQNATNTTTQLPPPPRVSARLQKLPPPMIDITPGRTHRELRNLQTYNNPGFAE